MPAWLSIVAQIGRAGMHGYQYSRGIVANRPGRYHDVERLIPDFSIRADTKSYLKSTPYFSVSVNWHDVLR